MGRREGVIDEIASYIEKNLKKGYTSESLKWALISQGYSKIEVEKALKKAELSMAQKAPVLETKPQIKYEIIPESPKKSFWRKFFG